MIFLPRDASAERGYEIAFVCLSVCPSVRNDQVPCSNTLEFFENNLTAKYLKYHVLVDAHHRRSGATGTPPKLGWNIGCELALNYRGDNVHLLIYV